MLKVIMIILSVSRSAEGMEMKEVEFNSMETCLAAAPLVRKFLANPGGINSGAAVQTYVVCLER